MEIQAPIADADRWVPDQLGRLEAIDPQRTRLVGSTDDLEWYAGHLTAIQAAYRVVEPPELRAAALQLGARLVAVGMEP